MEYEIKIHRLILVSKRNPAGYGEFLITSKVLDARRRGATTEPYGAIRRKHAPAQAREGASEDNGADDALLVNQGVISGVDRA